MIRFKAFRYFLVALVLAGGAFLCAQGDPQTDNTVPPHRVKIVPSVEDMDQLPPGKVKTLPDPRTAIKSPFNVDANRDSGRTIRILSEAQMSAGDRDLVADAQSSIEEKAGFQNLDFNGSGWTYNQLDCPAFPNHLFLRFTRDDGTREMSMFSASVTRNGNGGVHIIPIVRKGYSLFSPAPIAALTMAAFNRMRKEEGEAASADWLGTGLCYAALAGANPQVGQQHEGTQESGVPATLPPTLHVKGDGGAVVRFVDTAADRPMEWNLTFAGDGKLVKATHTQATLNSYKKVPHSANVTNAIRSTPQP